MASKKYIGLGVLFCAVVLAVCAADAIREIEIRPDPPKDGQQIFTVRFMPNESAVYDQIVFDCVLQRTLSLLKADGGREEKFINAGKFTARQRNIKMARNIDCYVSFFVRLENMPACDLAGNYQVVTNAPATVERMTIKAYRDKQLVWKVDTDARGKYGAEHIVEIGSSAPDTDIGFEDDK